MTRDGKRKREIRRIAREKGVSYSTASRIGTGENQKRFWWVNQNQTFDQELSGGYLWSPKRGKTGARIQFYENMREVAPGDVVFSFQKQRIRAVGVVRGFAYDSPKPLEFGSTGLNWSNVGWKVDVQYQPLENQIKPIDHMELLRPLLPSRYSPIQVSGEGNQVYLAEISREMAEVVAGLAGGVVPDILRAEPSRELIEGVDEQGYEEWEDQMEEEIRTRHELSDTEKETLVRSRRGQGVFKTRVMELERACRVTKVDNVAHLIGSHIKPWRDSSNEERLDGENGLLLTPSIDHLFDRGFISFKENGDLLVASRAETQSLSRMGVQVGINVGGFTRGQAKYLEYHRDVRLLRSKPG